MYCVLKKSSLRVIVFEEHGTSEGPLKPSLSMKILSINNFTTKLLSKLLSDLSIGVHLKGTKKFVSKVINRQLFHRRTVFHMKILSIINFTNKLLSIKDYFVNGPQ